MINSRHQWEEQLEKAKIQGDKSQIETFSYLLLTYTDDYFEKLEKFYNLLPSDGDLTLLVLKGHLLIEKQVRSYVYNHFPNQAVLKDVFKDTYSLFNAGKAYADPDCAETLALWECFLKLNKIRNLLAHELDHIGLQHRIDDFLKTSDRFISFGPDNDSVYSRMHNTINAIYQKALYLSTVQEKKYQYFKEQRA
ncbi:hypothetical protein AB6D06_20965 [Vibrio sp. 10N.239.311.G01]|uniref:RiboL-PSP-HEPN domain-containing protein n=1 Tax=Vibrio splendidus TaxID=29497 RepID=A0ABV4M223_VIBSP|nr:hypothetical protein [Vibrio splendidus]PMG49981.1 hypothetical protein BCU89_24785 [Vibrio splendidus]